jgi:hypothetical protein
MKKKEVVDTNSQIPSKKPWKKPLLSQLDLKETFGYTQGGPYEGDDYSAGHS